MNTLTAWKERILTVVFLAFFICASFSTLQVNAQEPPAALRAPTLQLELFGNSLMYSLSYDQRLLPRRDGLGIRAGVGYFSTGKEGSFTFLPLGLNYLIGKNSHFLELGLGVTFVSINSSYIFLDEQDRSVGTLTFGYRKQPQDGGVMFRIAMTPVFNEDFFFPFFGGLGFGYSW